ncbi:SRPBCC family protein [Lentzea sp. NBRC 102530]|uniref:SRPBCC family protein n=1 Tax=Lentzea sp. NBRC 102530 TaxID=3032201 RepID=UPI0024A4FA37|nr:SRPBCC family protein [Lentzea sp. NBRC 102530]GLY53074.1 hypothetical protein Lesp01_67300 [Lentzea sp. NBRC 102530]
MTEVHWPPGWGPAQCDSFVSHERFVAAAPEVLFDHLTAAGEWPEWQRGTTEVRAGGELSVGSGFVVVTALHALDGIVGELDRPERFGWIAVSDGLSFYQSWLLTPIPAAAPEWSSRRPPGARPRPCTPPSGSTRRRSGWPPSI